MTGTPSFRRASAMWRLVDKLMGRGQLAGAKERRRDDRADCRTFPPTHPEQLGRDSVTITSKRLLARAAASSTARTTRDRASVSTVCLCGRTE